VGRIRSVEKVRRRRAIVEAALAACARESFADQGMEAVARDAGIAKGTLFAYFRSRDELAAELLCAHLERWCDDLERRLERLPGPPSAPVLARLLAASLAGRAGLLELAAAAPSATLPPAWAAGLERAAAAVSRAAPALGPGGGRRVVRHALAVAPGLRGALLWPAASPVDELRAALEAHIIGVRASA
jgi:AcrR family transcriptional regulator